MAVTECYVSLFCSLNKFVWGGRIIFLVSHISQWLVFLDE